MSIVNLFEETTKVSVSKTNPKIESTIAPGIPHISYFADVGKNIDQGIIW
ncbi:hypothetical protein DDB_G0270332 [Dictyostelium discoideum AX4]|uniref:Uncharacterized protein n=1 Tax=Dictyostelium discoideum TaxID=44689 RepID=Q55BW7_DICDI|nr:hypothetical protein DDB_G0270332 [Dictyostelium discoideum AX4]EAL72516.1 hypothetical protein DDB_G0270332 [Dictyostelium discoideum AX4]|eukprot:XP_646714.1 hypothetical protein DDB_G0270332 [Dictyostelium discoideum AX4]